MKEIGQLLKEKRQSLNVSLEEVSIATKINIRILQALEDGDLDSLPAKTFIRGFVQSYAKYLGLDVKEVLSKLQEILGTTKPQMMQIPETSNSNDGKSPSGALEGDFLGKSKSILTFAAIVVTIVAIVVIQKVISKREAGLKNTTVQAITGSDAPVSITPAPTDTLSDPTPTPSPSPQESASPEPTITPTPEPQPSPTPVQVKAPVAKPKPIPSPEPSVAPAPPPTEAVAAPAVPQELIVEALDNVTIKISIDGKPAQDISMSADQIQTFKARGKIKFSTNNSGAISIIHNGKEIGVPGNLGQPLTLSYP